MCQYVFLHLYNSCTCMNCLTGHALLTSLISVSQTRNSCVAFGDSPPLLVLSCCALGSAPAVCLESFSRIVSKRDWLDKFVAWCEPAGNDRATPQLDA